MGVQNKLDKDLLFRFSQGEESAFKEIIELYKDNLYSFLRRFLNKTELIEDVFQETFMQLYLSRNSFDTDRAMKPWLFTIAANKARDALRKIQRTPETPLGPIADASDVSVDDVLNSITSFKETPYDEVSKEETAVQVRTIIFDMPDNLREILILAYFKQFSYKQMADILSIPIGTVKSRLHTAVVSFSKKWRSVNTGDYKGTIV